MIDLVLKCVPPSVTAQQKRLHFVNGRPVFFHDKRMAGETSTWASLLQPHVPAEPVAGPSAVTIVGVWPHRKATPKRDRDRLLPKTTKPDASNYSKHLEDLLVKMRFLAEDHLVGSLTIQKWWGPDASVGIRIRIAPMGAEEQPCL